MLLTCVIIRAQSCGSYFYFDSEILPKDLKINVVTTFKVKQCARLIGAGNLER